MMVHLLFKVSIFFIKMRGIAWFDASTNTDITFGCPCCSVIVAKQQTTTPADKWRNTDIGHYPPECLTEREQAKHVSTLVITEHKATLQCQ